MGIQQGRLEGEALIAMRVAVVGGGIAGLAAAWELTRAGAEVDLYEAGGRLGGAISTHQLAGVEFDAGAESFATRSRAVPELIEELGLQAEVVVPSSGGAWLQLPDLAAPLPATGILGVPADPSADDVAAILGVRAAERATEDFQTPVDRWVAASRSGERPSVGEVVRDRMGEAVVERLVTPIVSGVHSAQADDLDMETAAPGLFSAMLECGSLARAVAVMRAKAPAGSAVNSLRGGMNRVVTALEEQLRKAGVRVHLNHEVKDLAEVGIYGTGMPDGVGSPYGSGLRWADLPERVSSSWSDHAILAVDEPMATALADPYAELPREARVGATFGGPASAGDAAEVGAGRGVALVSMVLYAPELDERPRGTGMLVAPSVVETGAKAMTHVSAKWEWAAEELRAELGEGHHLLRLSYGRVTDDPDSGALGFGSSDDQLRRAAVEDVGRLFGLPLGSDRVLDVDVVRWRKALPQASSAHRERTQALREALRAQQEAGGPSIDVVGSWFAGTGLARVIPDARHAARTFLQGRLRG